MPGPLLPPTPVEETNPEVPETPEDGVLPAKEASTPPPLATRAGEGGGAPAAGSGEGDPSPAAGPGDPAPRFQPPRLLAGALPIDPEDSDELDVPEEIPVRLRIAKDGTVKEIVPADPDLSGILMKALEESARVMRFIPARVGDEPVEAWFSMTFIYRH
jgi:hypothetical protein